MADFKLDDLGDIDITSGGLKIEQGTEQEYLQRINQFVNMNVGNWFADPRYGMPYMDTEEGRALGLVAFLGNKRTVSPSYIFKMFRSRIRELPYVQEAEGSFTQDKASRKMVITLNITINNGVQITYIV